MFINFGTKATNLQNGQIINVDCPSCEKVTTMKYSVFGKYGYAFWIPFFPIKKITVAECNSCYKTFDYPDLYESIRTKIQRETEKNPVRYPVWMLSGVFILFALMGYGIYDSKMTDLNNEVYIKNPKAGDVYYLKASNGHFTTLRIDKVSKTEVYITNNDFEIDLESDIFTIDESKNYNKFKDTINVLNLQESLNNETIIKIIRNHE
ncbi:MAG: hypothetical protein LCH35_07760 [Bacteroidetes bacterium]|uniref:hypothetical protein n=1 Tax=Flavobacterium sp. TaxID=239 RepID=UPI002FDA8FA5|nr:hypothetical protein [Bacteroidota bacterium]